MNCEWHDETIPDFKSKLLKLEALELCVQQLQLD